MRRRRRSKGVGKHDAHYKQQDNRTGRAKNNVQNIKNTWKRTREEGDRKKSVLGTNALNNSTCACRRAITAVSRRQTQQQTCEPSLASSTQKT